MVPLFPKSHLAELSYLPCLNSLATDDAWLPPLYFQALMLSLDKEERFVLWTFSYTLTAVGTMGSKNPIYCTAKWAGARKTDFSLLHTTAPLCEGHVPCALKDAAAGFQRLRTTSFFLIYYLRQVLLKNCLSSAAYVALKILNKWCLCRSAVLPRDTQSETSLALLWFFQSCPSAAAFLPLPSSKSWENTLGLSRNGIQIIKIPIISIYGTKALHPNTCEVEMQK